MNFFVNAALKNPYFVKLQSYIESENQLPAMVTGVSHICKAHFLAALTARLREDEPALIIAESEGEAQRLCSDINMMLGSQSVLLYPEKN